MWALVKNIIRNVCQDHVCFRLLSNLNMNFDKRNPDQLLAENLIKKKKQQSIKESRERERERDLSAKVVYNLFMHMCIIRFCIRAWNVNNFLKGNIG